MDKIKYRYFLSDIHGCYDAMIEALSIIDLDDEEVEVYFTGDYIDSGNCSFKVLYQLKDLQEKYGKRIIVLPGNHEQALIEWIYSNDEFLSISNIPPYETLSDIVGESEINRLKPKTKKYIDTKAYNENIKKIAKDKHSELLKWLLKIYKNKYYENDKQIILHAGIMEVEDENELWKMMTPEEYFLNKYPADTGYFYKDIIAGHVSSRTVSRNDDYLGSVFYDGKSHFYIDGETPLTKIVPVLKYNVKTKVYSSFEKNLINNKEVWKEYIIR